LTEVDAPKLKLVDNPDTATDTELQQEKNSIAEYAAYYRTKFRQLAGWVRDTYVNKPAK
jgi:hypothetical protein